MREQLTVGILALVGSALLIAEASADRRANLSAARSNLGGAAAARGGGGNIGGSVNRGNFNRGNIGGGNINRGNVNVPSSRPSIQRPNNSVPSLGGGANINRPSINRPSTGGSISRPGTGVTRPGIGITRPGGGTSIPDFGSRPINRPDLGSGNRPGLGNRPEFERPTTLPERPSRDRLEDFLNIQRPNRPSVGERPGLGNRERPIDTPSFDRPGWDQRPQRPIIGDRDRNERIHNRPGWVDIDRDRLARVHDRWGDAITRRPDELQRWTQRRPDRVARWRSWGNSVRFRWVITGNGVFGPVWWTNHHPIFCRWHHWHHWNRHPWSFWWRRTTFPVLSRWFIWRGPVVVWSQPIFYDFGPGGNVNFIDNRVFISGADVGSVEEFAQSAAQLATVSAPESDEELDATEWMPLGTFAVSTSDEEGAPTRFIQLAVSEQGIISGTYFNEQTEVSQTVLGQVDRQTQRVAMRLGEDEDLVIETGLYNLTLDEAPVLVHFGPERYEFFLLIRMDEPVEE